MAGYQQFLDTVGNFFERAGTELHKKGKQYDSEGSPSFLLIDKQRKSLYLMEIGHTGKNIELDIETLDMAETFARENSKSEEIIRLIVALARAIIIAEQNKINHPDIDDLQQRSALVVEDALSEELNKFLDDIKIEYRKVPFKGAFTIFFFNVDNSILLGDFYYDFLDETEAILMNRSIGEAEAIQLAKEQKESREKVGLGTVNADGSINRFDHITDPDSIYLDGISTGKATQEKPDDSSDDIVAIDTKTESEIEEERVANIKQKAKEKFDEAARAVKNIPTKSSTKIKDSSVKGQPLTQATNNRAGDALKSTVDSDTKRYTRPTSQAISKEKLSDFASKANKGAFADANDILQKINTREFRDEQRAKKENRSKAQAQKEANLKSAVTNEGRVTHPTTALEQKMALRKQMVTTELLRKDSKEKFEALKKQREQEKQEILLKQQQFIEETTIFHDANRSETYATIANFCTHFTEAITFLPVYILKRITKSKMPDGILYWIGAMVTLIGVYFIPLSKIGGALTNRMSGTAGNIMTSIGSLFASWRVDALMTDMPPAIASMLSTFISCIYFMYSIVSSGMHYVSGSFHLRFLLAFAFAIAAVSAFRKFGRGLISFILLTFILYFPIMATGNFAIKRIIKAAPDYMTVFIAAEAGYTSTLLTIMPTIAGILFATILVPIAVIVLAMKGSNRGKGLEFPQTDEEVDE